MPSLRSRLVELVLADTTLAVQRRAHRLCDRVLARGPRELVYVHQVDDPYGLLVLARLPELVDACAGRLTILVLPATDERFAPAPELARAWALRDAAGLARRHGLAFPEHPVATLDPAAVDRALADALVERPWRDAVARLRELGHALLAGDPLTKLPELDAAGQARLDRDRDRALALGHYQGGMIRDAGEWFWGLDRLPRLAARLRAEGVTIEPRFAVPGPVEIESGPTGPRVWGASLPADPGTPIELFYSLRSPYSYLALARTRALAERHGVDLKVRLLLPMVMRGLAVPRAKRLYLARDAKQVAGELGLGFGRIADPLGRGVERGLGVAMHAREQGRLLDWLAAVGRAVWAEGVDVSTDAGLIWAARAAGLDPTEVLAASERDDWWAEVADNRERLAALGLWGVPVFAYGELIVWGQDRLDVLDAAVGHVVARGR